MELLKPNTQRAKNALIFLWIVLALDVLSLISAWLQYNLIQTVIDGGSISEAEATANDLRERVIGIIYLLAYIPCGILFICWFRRAYYNLHLKHNYLHYDEGSAASGWFIPILNFFRPFQIMKELYEETDKILVARVEGYTERTNKTILGLWWALWIITSILARFFFRAAMDAQTVEEIMSATECDILISLMDIPLAFLAIKLVKDYSNMEILLAELKDEPKEPETNPETEPPLMPVVE